MKKVFCFLFPNLPSTPWQVLAFLSFLGFCFSSAVFAQGVIPTLSADAPVSKPTVTLSEMKSRLPTFIPPTQSDGSNPVRDQASQTISPSPDPIEADENSEKIPTVSESGQKEQDSQADPEERIRSLEIELMKKNLLIQSLEAEHATVYAAKESLASEFAKLQSIMISLGDDRRARLQDAESSSLGSRVPHTNGWHFLENRGWLWTAPSVFPMIFSTERGGWLYYEVGTHAPWILYDYQRQAWETW